MQEGLKEAIEVPLSVMRIAHGCWEHMITMATHGNNTALSDIQVCKLFSCNSGLSLVLT